MRTVKFRGKDEEGGWLHGDLLQRLGFWPTITESYCTDEGKVGYREIAVDEKTVGQFTGLTDKNGKEIYEGDIVECGSLRLVCEFVEGGFEFRDPCDDRLVLKAIVMHSSIIGNIHDNPELLENIKE